MATYDINIRDYWRIIRKRRAIVVAATIIFTVFSYLFAFLGAPDPLYEATSAVKVEKAADLTTLLLDTVSWSTWDNVATQAVIITSFPVLERTAKQMGLIPENVSSAKVRSTGKYLQIVTELKAQVTTEQEGNTNIINITATSTTPEQVALIANTVAEAFRQANIEERNKKVRDTRIFIEKQLDVVQGHLREAEQNLRAFEETTKLVALDAQTTSALDRLTNLESKVAQLQQRSLEIQRQLGSLQQLSQGERSGQEGIYLENPPPVLAKLIVKFGDLSLRRKILLTDYTEEHPEVAGVDAELQNIISEMDKELRSISATLDSQLHELETRLQAARAQTITIPARALKLARLKREVDVNAELHSQLESKYQEALIQESGLIEEVTIIKPALVPSQPINSPKTAMNTVTGGIIGLVLGLVLALVVETMDTSLGTIEDVEEILNIPVLGIIPFMGEHTSKEKGRAGSKLATERLVTHFAPRSPVAEAYRSLRTSLQFIRMDKRAKVFLITSSSLQEGKTYNVVNLSLSLAQAGEKVLLIDADLRRPMIHRIFGLDRQPGLTEYVLDEFGWSLPSEATPDQTITELIMPRGGENGWKNVVNTITDVMLGEFEIDDILKTPGLDNLHLISAGASPSNPTEILSSPRFKKFMEEVRDQYDIVIIDTPPVLPVADAFEVAPKVDGVVLVYEVGRIGRGILSRAKTQLENVKGNVLGVILNNVKPDVSPDLYGYRTDYYYREEGDKEAEPPPSRWWDSIGHSVQSIISKIRLSSAGKGKRSNLLGLILLIGILSFAALTWQSYPGLRLAYHRWVGSKQEVGNPVSPHEKRPIFPTKPTQAKSEKVLLSDHSPSSALENPPAVKGSQQKPTVGKERIKADRPTQAGIHEAAKTEPSSQAGGGELSREAQATSQAPIAVAPAMHYAEPAKLQEPPVEASIERFLERWRHSWEQGNLPTYIALYHPQFESQGMDSRAWKNYKQDLFNRTPRRDVQISDIDIQINGSSAVTTFKQRYQTTKYEGFGLKTLHLNYHLGKWRIIKESSEPFPEVREPAAAAIQRFVEKWRRAWEEGNLQSYIACYDPGFETKKMNYQTWKGYKQDLFNRYNRRDIQISVMEIKLNQTEAVVTLKQRYQTANHQTIGLKTLHLRRHKDRWAIFNETWRPLPAQG